MNVFPSSSALTFESALFDWKLALLATAILHNNRVLNKERQQYYRVTLTVHCCEHAHTRTHDIDTATLAGEDRHGMPIADLRSRVRAADDWRATWRRCCQLATSAESGISRSLRREHVITEAVAVAELLGHSTAASDNGVIRLIFFRKPWTDSSAEVRTNIGRNRIRTGDTLSLTVKAIARASHLKGGVNVRSSINVYSKQKITFYFPK